ncbi:unnamed protein product [Brassica rapa subsp. narinosa]
MLSVIRFSAHSRTYLVRAMERIRRRFCFLVLVSGQRSKDNSYSGHFLLLNVSQIFFCIWYSVSI